MKIHDALWRSMFSVICLRLFKSKRRKPWILYSKLVPIFGSQILQKTHSVHLCVDIVKLWHQNLRTCSKSALRTKYHFNEGILKAQLRIVRRLLFFFIEFMIFICQFCLTCSRHGCSVSWISSQTFFLNFDRR